MRAATHSFSKLVQHISISIPAAHAGCDVRSCNHFAAERNFNPRSPCGLRLDWNSVCCIRYLISIPAAHAGCDIVEHQMPKLRHNFNPRSPCGLRLLVIKYSKCPVRISIPAAHAGCDLLSISRLFALHYFNPRSPCGLRHSKRDFCGYQLKFQSPQPMRAATLILANLIPEIGISIPAAHAGCDKTGINSTSISPDFNPRSPCGLRQLYMVAQRLFFLYFVLT